MKTLIADPEDYIEALRAWIEEKDEPEKWHVVHGGPARDYQMTSADVPDELSESECGPDGVATIGYLGWSADAFADGEFVGEAMSEGDKIDRRSNGVLLVHEDILSGGDEDA